MKRLSNRAPPHGRLCSSVPAGMFDLLLVPMRNITSTVRANHRAADQRSFTSLERPEGGCFGYCQL
jgi:hypothetical protein